MTKRNVIIMGAMGRDYHEFLTFFKDNTNYNVVAFTVAQIPTAKRKFPKELAGKNYKSDIPIYLEEKLSEIIKKLNVQDVFLSYTDLSYQEVMRKSAIVNSAGANFCLLGPEETMLKSKKTVIAVCGVRTGAGKSPVSRYIARLIKGQKRLVVIRHPMPYGDLKKQVCQRFSTKEDLLRHNCTIEEREEYESHINEGNILYAGVDYAKILKEAEKEADIILWDGGNNDFPFIKPDILITVADALRPNHEITYYPGEVNFRMADIILVNKCDVANPMNVETVVRNAKDINPKAQIIKGALMLTVDNPDLVKGKRVLVIEDGPTLTHGGMPFGAGTAAANNLGAMVVNPRANAVGSIKEIYNKYSNVGAVLPAMGYSKEQLKDLEETINSVNCDTVLIATPIDLRSLININKPSARVRYSLREITKPDLREIFKNKKLIS